MEIEILRQTVITGHPSVQAAHLPLAIASMQEQLTANDSDLAALYRQHNQGGLILAERGYGKCVGMALGAGEPVGAPGHRFAGHGL